MNIDTNVIDSNYVYEEAVSEYIYIKKQSQVIALSHLPDSIEAEDEMKEASETRPEATRTGLAQGSFGTGSCELL